MYHKNYNSGKKNGTIYLRSSKLLRVNPKKLNCICLKFTHHNESFKKIVLIGLLFLNIGHTYLFNLFGLTMM